MYVHVYTVYAQFKSSFALIGPQVSGDSPAEALLSVLGEMEPLQDKVQ